MTPNEEKASFWACKKWMAAGLALLLLLPFGAYLLKQQPMPFHPANEWEGRRQALDCFLDAAFGAEYGDKDLDRLMRWESPIRIFLKGQVTREDAEAAAGFVNQLRQRLPQLPDIAIAPDEKAANVRITFAPLHQLPSLLPEYVAGNWGFFYYQYKDWRITGADIVIASDVTTPQQRRHLLLEELVGVLGLGRDIYTYSDSIIYQPWSQTQQLSDVDWLMLAYLYHPDIKPGMNQAEVYAALLPTLYTD